MQPTRHSGDPLRAMYFIAALLMGVASVVVVVLMFVSSGALGRPPGENAWVPGTGDTYEAPAAAAAPAVDTLTAEQREEMHHH
jgi:hypothetical protein